MMSPEPTAIIGRLKIPSQTCMLSTVATCSFGGVCVILLLFLVVRVRGIVQLLRSSPAISLSDDLETNSGKLWCLLTKLSHDPNTYVSCGMYKVMDAALPHPYPLSLLRGLSQKRRSQRRSTIEDIEQCTAETTSSVVGTRRASTSTLPPPYQISVSTSTDTDTDTSTYIYTP